MPTVRQKEMSDQPGSLGQVAYLELCYMNAPFGFNAVVDVKTGSDRRGHIILADGFSTNRQPKK